MELDTVLECVLGPNGTGVFRVSWNDKTKNEVISAPSGFITNTSVASDDGRLVCAGTWNHVPRLLGDPNFLFKVYDLSGSSKYNLMLARGYADPVTDLSSSAHQSSPPRKIKQQFAITHAVLMMSAWWIFGSTAILSARYLKNAESTCCTAPVWWALHRPLMLLSFLCASIAFFFIYYSLGWKVKTCSIECPTDTYLGIIHTLVGTVTYAFMCFQVLLGIFRPSTDSPVRPCYNWLHWAFGTASWICASTTCATSLAFGKTGLQAFYQNWPRHIMMTIILTFIATALICEYFQRFRVAEGSEKVESSSSLSPIVPLVIVCNLLVAITGVALITWMIIQAFLNYGFTF